MTWLNSVWRFIKPWPELNMSSARFWRNVNGACWAGILIMLFIIYLTLISFLVDFVFWVFKLPHHGVPNTYTAPELILRSGASVIVYLITVFYTGLLLYRLHRLIYARIDAWTTRHEQAAEKRMETK